MINRRRFLALSIALTHPIAHAFRKQSGGGPVEIWRSQALGANIHISIDQTSAQIMGPKLDYDLAKIRQDIEQIESIFSLYRPNSLLMQLNSQGYLEDPPWLFVELLNHARALHELTQGYFDPTIQPLWQALARQENTERARQLIGFNRIHFDSAKIEFSDPQMALSLNGIVQGFATDLVTERLKNLGYAHSLLNIGEVAGIGPWRVGIENSDDTLIDQLSIVDQAVATSSPFALTLGNHSHILSTDESVLPKWKTVSVIAKTATLADGLSTGCVYLSESHIQHLANDSRIHRILVEDLNGELKRFSSNSV